MASGSVGGGGSLSEVYSSAKRILLKARDGIERLERFESSSMDSPDLASSVKRDITEVRSLCSNMDALWRSIHVKSQRDLWRRKTEQVGEEAEYLNQSLEKYMSRNQRKMLDAKERADLLGRASGEGAHILQIFDEEAQAMNSVKNSKQMLEESFSSGVAILSKYAEQRDRLKRAQRKALDVLNTVGLSNSVLRLIERRNRVDTWIKYADIGRPATEPAEASVSPLVGNNSLSASKTSQPVTGFSTGNEPFSQPYLGQQLHFTGLGQIYDKRRLYR